MKSVKKELIEDSVYHAIIRALNDDKFITEVAKQAVEIHNSELEESRELKILKKQKSEVDRKLSNITEAICNGIFNNLTQAKMIELTNISNELQVKITTEESRVILPLQEQNVINFLKNFTKIIRCSEKEKSLDNKKALFDLFINEVIFDGVRFLIIMKTTDEPENEIADKKTEVNQKVFGLLPFGDPAGNRTRD